MEYEAELGQLIKTALLWLEDDLMQRYGRHLLEISPKNLLTEGYARTRRVMSLPVNSRSYLTKVEGRTGFTSRLEALWEEAFPWLATRNSSRLWNNGTLWEGPCRVRKASMRY